MVTTALLLLQVILLDIVLSGDNAVVIAMAASGLSKGDRRDAITLGMVFAVALRGVLCFAATLLLAYPTIKLVAGVLLLWISYSMYQEIKSTEAGTISNVHPQQSFMWAILQILIADASMSLDNVVAVASLAQGHPYIMVIGLAFSIGLMAIAANSISEWMNRFPFIKYIGLGLIIYIAISMTFHSALGLYAKYPIKTW